MAHTVRETARRRHRVVVTALSERDGKLLLVQLRAGEFAEYWLLPSATHDEGTLSEAMRSAFHARTGHPAEEAALLAVVEEPKGDVTVLRFVFRVESGECEGEPSDPEVARALGGQGDGRAAAGGA